MSRAIRAALAAALTAACCGASGQSYPPKPPPRPADLSSAAQPTVAAPATGTDEDCAALRADGGIVAAAKQPVAGDGACGIASPVALEAIVLADKRRVDLAPAPVMRCDLALAVVDWLRREVLPIAEETGGKVRRIVTADAYACRPRNGVPGAHLSEHARGNALDVVALEFASGPPLAFAAKEASVAATRQREAACARFATVLGPGSDGFHEDHVHVDLAPRHGGAKLCQWDLR